MLADDSIQSAAPAAFYPDSMALRRIELAGGKYLQGGLESAGILGEFRGFVGSYS